MKRYEIAIALKCPLWRKRLPNVRSLARRAALTALRAVEPGGHKTAVSLLFSDNAALQILNRTYREMDKPTNVLAFPASQQALVHLGDIALAAETVFREAEEQDKPAADHVTHLIIHGVLHLLGFDHIEDREAAEMEAMERRILALLEIPDPYRAAA
jgi:probable rRNA maturation factor